MSMQSHHVPDSTDGAIIWREFVEAQAVLVEAEKNLEQARAVRDRHRRRAEILRKAAQELEETDL